MFNIRPRRSGDDEALADMLEAEGVKTLGFLLPDSATWIIENGFDIKGFITARRKNKYPWIQHFVVHKSCRGLSRYSYNLIATFDNMMKYSKFSYFVIALSVNREKMCALVDKYFGKRIMQIKETEDGKRRYLVRTL